MKQIVITRYGRPEVFKIKELPNPEVKEGEVLIQTKASGVNFADILARKGLYLDAPKAPCVVGYEVSGEVKKIGAGVSKEWLEKRVMCLTRFGGYSDTVVVPQSQIFEIPHHLSFEEAAALPVNYLTAYQLIVAMGSLKQEESILIHNAGGGVGLAALDIAKHIGAITYGTASSQKHAFLKSRGLDYAIDYRKEDWLPKLMELTGHSGVELVLDPLGGASWKKSFKALRATGRLGMFGVSTVTESKLFGRLRFVGTALGMPWFHPLGLLDTNKAVFGVNMGHLWHETEKISKWMTAILEGLTEGWICPHVDKVFTFDQVGQAHEYIEARKNTGKVILVPSL